MWISSFIQTGVCKLFILCLVSSLTACGGGGGGDKKPDLVTSSTSSFSSALNSSRISSFGNSSSSDALISSSGSSGSGSLGNSSGSSTSSLIVFPIDTTPDSFSFAAVTGAALNSSITSEVITISGINTAVPISILNGEYSINGGAFTSAAGTINNGQSVALRLVSAATISTEKQAEITISGVAISFLVTTTNILGGSVQGAQLNIAGVVTTMAGLPPDADGIGLTANFNVPLGTVIVGPHLYVADADNNKIRKIEISTGAVTTFAGSGIYGDADGVGTAAAFEQPSGITSDGTHLYIADTFNSKIRKIEIATGVVSTFAGSGVNGISDGGGTAASFHSPRDITTDGTHLYVADTVNHKIRKIDIATGVVTTLAGSGLGNVDGTATAARFYYPRGITTDGIHIYVADTDNNKIRKIEIVTGVVTTLAGSGSYGMADGTGTAATFRSPRGLTTDGTSLYVADDLNHIIRKIELATGVVTTFAGSGFQSDADGTGRFASFRYPCGITTDGVHLYVTETGNNKIRKIEIASRTVTTLAGGNSQGIVDGTGAEASFRQPVGIATDGIHLYVADTQNNNIRKISIATGMVTAIAGSGFNGSSDGERLAASFASPHGITTDGTYLYVADTWGNKIRKIEIITGIVTTLAGSGSEGNADGTGAAASFAYPRGITTDGTYLYVADTWGNKIRKIEIMTGIVTTLAGSDSEGNADGIGVAASFASPRGITTDGTHLYIADTGNHKIRKIEISTGVVTTLAGTGNYGIADGAGTAANFRYPNGITIDGTNLYVADAENHKIRKIDIATGMVATLAGSGNAGTADGAGTAANFHYPSGITTDGFALYVTDSENNTIRKIE